MADLVVGMFDAAGRRRERPARVSRLQRSARGPVVAAGPTSTLSSGFAAAPSVGVPEPVRKDAHGPACPHILDGNQHSCRLLGRTIGMFHLLRPRRDKIMEFHIKTRGVSPDLEVINDALTAIDPSAMADIDPADASLRIAVELSSPELLALLTRVGYPVDWKQLEQMPSVCCGACGG